MTDEASKHLEEDIIPLFAKEFSGIVLSSKTDVRITEVFFYLSFSFFLLLLIIILRKCTAKELICDIWG